MELVSLAKVIDKLVFSHWHLDTLSTQPLQTIVTVQGGGFRRKCYLTGGTNVLSAFPWRDHFTFRYTVLFCHLPEDFRVR